MVSGTRVRLASALFSAILTLLSGAVPAAAQPETTIRVDVRLVRLLATVKDPAGSLVGTLSKNDFELFDNGSPQQVSVFERQTEQPLSVAILIDTSGSTAKDLKYETESVLRFLRALLREGNPADAAALYSFNWEIVRQNSFTRNVSAIEHSLRNLKGEAGTSLYDAVLLASRDIEDRQGRKILVVVTDGGDTISRTDFQHAIEAAQLADAVIYPLLVVPIANDAGRNTGGENALTTMAQRTGGRVFEPTLGAQIDRAFDQILSDLRTQYLIGFYPKNVPLSKDRFHTLRVTVRDPRLHVTTRSGYYGDAEPDAAAGSATGARPAVGDETIRGRKPPPPASPVKKGKANN